MLTAGLALRARDSHCDADLFEDDKVCGGWEKLNEGVVADVRDEC